MSESPALYQEYSKLRLSHSVTKPDSQDPAAQSRSETSNGKFFDITELWISEDEPGETYPTGTTVHSKSLADKRFGEYSLLLRRVVVPQQKPRLQLELQSASLRAEFGRVGEHLSTTLNIHANPIIIKAPYWELYHSRDELSHALQETTPDDLKRELSLIRDFEKEHMARAINQIDGYIRAGQISFEYLWALFKPGELIILQVEAPAAKNRWVLSCAVFQHYSIQTTAHGTFWNVRIRHMAVDNGRIGSTEQKYVFPAFDGLANIDTLPAYPLKFCKEEKKVRMELEERGRTYLRLCSLNQVNSRKAPSVLQEYDGPVWMQIKDWSTEGCSLYDLPAKAVHGRVLVDLAGFVSEKSIFQTKIAASTLRGSNEKPSGDDSDDDDYDGGIRRALRNLQTTAPEKHIDWESMLDSESLMCFPARIPGYSLVTKDIGFFLVNELQDVTWEEETVQDLIQKNHRMQLVFNIVSGFSYESHRFDYSIGDKGRGLVFLFYGPSGAGKTLTAECIAESLRRPLWRVSGSELGTETYKIEQNLQRAFERVARWEAILLLDEADAFMAERKDDSLERNALVSILLRLLEYQSGIIMLTTNREQDFDPAFHSRVHVRIQYPGLTASEREVIWRKLLANPGTNAPSHAGISNSDYERLGNLNLDGRSIHNAVRVAELFARARSEDDLVTVNDLKSVLQIAIGNVSGELKKQLEEFCSS